MKAKSTSSPRPKTGVQQKSFIASNIWVVRGGGIIQIMTPYDRGGGWGPIRAKIYDVINEQSPLNQVVIYIKESTVEKMYKFIFPVTQEAKILGASHLPVF